MTREQLENNMTLNNLLGKMDILYGKFINTEWKPKIISEIEKKIETYEKQLEELGPEKLTNMMFYYIFEKKSP